MTRSAIFTTGIAALIMLLSITASWGQPVCVAPGCNPTTSNPNQNTAGGTGALINVVGGSTGGFNNTAFGRSALADNTTGGSNTASGVSALTNNTTGFGNTANGVSALLNNTTGGFNTASGFEALRNNTTGRENTAVGLQALLGNSSGERNTAIGTDALTQSTGNKNIGVGYHAGSTLTSGNNNIYIGNQGAGAESQTIRVGTAQTRTFIAGISPTNLGTGEIVAIDPATGQLGIASISSARYKQDIAPMGSRSEGVLQLRPVTFSYKDDAQTTMRYGLVAEEVAAVYPQLVTYAPTGAVRTVKYHELIPMLLNELQREHREVATLKQELGELATLRKELAELRAVVESRLEK